MPKSHRFQNLIGQRFGRLVVLDRAPTRNDGRYRTRWYCICDCGKTHIAQAINLKAGDVKSCGCLFQDFMKQEKRTPRPQCRKPTGVVAFDYLYNNYKSNAKRRGYIFLLDKEQFRRLIAMPCFFCGIPPVTVCKRDYDSILYNGLDRLDNSLGYVEGNAAPCCARCNMMKSTMSVPEFFDAIATIHNKKVSASENELRGSEPTIKNRKQFIQ
jgi:hypothetical protein